MARIYHKCPITGKEAFTGMDLPEGMLNDVNLHANTYQCQHCGGMHQWNGSQAFQIKEALLSTPDPIKEARYLIDILKKVHDQSTYEKVLNKNRKIKKHRNWLPKDFQDLATIIQIIIMILQILPKQPSNNKIQNVEINNNKHYYYYERKEGAESDSLVSDEPRKKIVKKGKIRKTIYI